MSYSMSKNVFIAMVVSIAACSEAAKEPGPASGWARAPVEPVPGAPLTPVAAPVEPPPPPPPAEPTSNWQVRKQVDAMTDQTEVFVATTAIEPVAGTFGQASTAGLIVRCAEKQVDIILKTDNIIDYDVFSDTAKGRYRFDSKPAETIRFTVATSHDAVFFRKPRGWVKIFQKNAASVFAVELPVARGAPIVAKFDLKGADKDLQQVLDACPK